jgi:hypothetical protein
MTIRWGGSTPQIITLVNCTIADKKVYGSVDAWAFVYRDMTVAGTGGMVNPL